MTAHSLGGSLFLISPEIEDTFDFSKPVSSGVARSGDYSLNSTVSLSKFLYILRCFSEEDVARETFEKSLYILLLHVKHWSTSLDEEHFAKIHAATLTALNSMVKEKGGLATGNSDESFVASMLEQLNLIR